MALCHESAAPPSRIGTTDAYGFRIPQRRYPEVEHVPLIADALLEALGVKEYPRVSAALNQEWGLCQFLVPWRQRMPRDFAGSMRGGEIAARVAAERALSPEMRHAVILGAAFSDVGRLGSDPAQWDERVEIFTTTRRWRSETSAPEWEVVHKHPSEGRKMVGEVIGNENPIAVIVGSHHALKREDPYPANAVRAFSTLTSELQEAIKIVTAVDVAEAFVSRLTERGRGYIDPCELEGQSLTDFIVSQVAVDLDIAESAARHAFAYRELSSTAA